MAVTLSWADLVTIAGTDGEDLLAILEPYIPALITASDQVYIGFLQNLGQGNLEGLTTLMYGSMAVKDRELLEAQVYKDLVTATQAKADRATLFKEIAFKLAMDLILAIASGGISTVITAVV